MPPPPPPPPAGSHAIPVLDLLAVTRSCIENFAKNGLSGDMLHDPCAPIVPNTNRIRIRFLVRLKTESKGAIFRFLSLGVRIEGNDSERVPNPGSTRSPKTSTRRIHYRT